MKSICYSWLDLPERFSKIWQFRGILSAFLWFYIFKNFRPFCTFHNLKLGKEKEVHCTGSQEERGPRLIMQVSNQYFCSTSTFSFKAFVCLLNVSNSIFSPFFNLFFQGLNAKLFIVLKFQTILSEKNPISHFWSFCLFFWESCNRTRKFYFFFLSGDLFFFTESSSLTSFD